jgi:hypothetical protein
MSQQSANSNISFEHAVHDSAQLLGQIEANRLQDSQITDSVAALVQSLAGARGFFVTYLTDESKIGETHPEPIVEGLSRSPEIVNDLIAKNLVMSSSMALTHERNGADDLLTGSQRVTRRCMSLAERLRSDNLQVNFDSMLAAIESLLAKRDDGFDVESTLSAYSFGVGGKISSEMKAEYETFLHKWRYDSGQLKSARANVQTVLKQLRKDK